MNYAKIKNEKVIEFPYTIDSLKRDNPYTNYDLSQDFIYLFSTTESAGEGFELVSVEYQTQPSHDSLTQKVSYNEFPVLIDNVWTVLTTIENKTPEEIDQETETKARLVREDRNYRLKETDWVVVKSVETGMPIDQSWAKYRQSLRDITTQSSFPWDVIWPEQPQ